MHEQPVMPARVSSGAGVGTPGASRLTTDEMESLDSMSASSKGSMSGDSEDNQEKQLLQWLAQPNSTPREVRLTQECRKQMQVLEELRGRLDAEGSRAKSLQSSRKATQVIRESAWLRACVWISSLATDSF